VRQALDVNVEDFKGTRYKMLDDLLDGIFCAYLAYYFWHRGEAEYRILGDTEAGYVALPACRLPNCELESTSQVQPTNQFETKGES